MKSTVRTFIVGPPPDAAYRVEVIGTIRPDPLSSSNPTTYLTQYLPDLFMAASLVFGAGYLQNYGAMVDNPQQAVSWESHYQALKASADMEENRKKYASQAWTSKRHCLVSKHLPATVERKRGQRRKLSPATIRDRRLPNVQEDLP
jgi:hypothetical protein